jgi:hypothetical protein
VSQQGLAVAITPPAGAQDLGFFSQPAGSPAPAASPAQQSADLSAPQTTAPGGASIAFPSPQLSPVTVSLGDLTTLAPINFPDESAPSVAPNTPSNLSNYLTGASIGLGAVDHSVPLPVEGDFSLKSPVNNGWWDGERGNSGFYSNNPKVTRITGRTPVQYSNGVADLSPWAKASYNFPNLTGDRPTDAGLLVKRIMQEQNLTAKPAQRWISQQGQIHHNGNLATLELIPKDLHSYRTTIGHFWPNFRLADCWIPVLSVLAWKRRILLAGGGTCRPRY